MNTEPLETEAESQALDALLAAAPDYAPSLALRARVTQSGLARQPTKPRARPLRTWMSGAALAAACAAGVMLGAQMSGDLITDPAAETLSQTATAFDDASTYLETETG